ncbi:MAG TPA: transposase [Blastocatellia bacterium]|nr:transposase [Blastocatellia bacterium]
MLPELSLLVRLVRMVDDVPTPPPRLKGRRGAPVTYPERIFLKGLLVMLLRQLTTAHALLAFLEQDDLAIAQLRAELSAPIIPSRRTWERRLAQLPQRLPELIGSLGRRLVTELEPWLSAEGPGEGHAAALDSTPLKTGGGVWHKRDRQQGVIPHSAIDTEAGWSKSGCHGWWFGCKLHLSVTTGHSRIPLAAEVTVANVGDNLIAPELLAELPEDLRYLLGDAQSQDPGLREVCEERGFHLITPRRGPHPHRDDGVGVRRIFHRLRSQTMEPFNGIFKDLFGWHWRMPVRGLQKTQILALGAVWLYQLVLRYPHRQQLEPGKGIKALLRAA